MKVIDLDTWDRASHYHFFLRADFAHYNVCTNLDITRFKAHSEQLGLPFYYAMLYAVIHGMNQVPAFRYRIRNGQVVLHDRVHPYFADLTEGSELFKMVLAEFDPDIRAFVAKAKEKAAGQTVYFRSEDLAGRDDVVFLSCLPWVAFTSISHTMSFRTEDAVPRLSWGKYFRQDGKQLLPFSVQAHHSFVDGIHMGQYINCVQDFLNEF